MTTKTVYVLTEIIKGDIPYAETQVYNTFEDAYAAMEESFDEFCEELSDDEREDAYISDDFASAWQLDSGREWYISTTFYCF